MIFVAIGILLVYVVVRVFAKTRENAEQQKHSPVVDKMRNLGFIDQRGTHWYLSRSVGKDITFNLLIDKKTGEYEIRVLEELFGEPEFYGLMLPVQRDAIKWNIDAIINELRLAGIDLSIDHSKYGMEK
jgi:hypothetical protein